MRMTQSVVLVAVLCVGNWALAQAQQDQQSQQAQQQAQQAQEQARQAQQQAQQGQQDQQPQQRVLQGHQGQQGQMGQMGGKVLAPALIQSPNEWQVQGKIVGKSKDVDVQGDKEHRVVKVQTQQGQMMMVDLGRTDLLPKGFEINENQWVIVTGVTGRLGNDQVLVAHNVANVFNLQPGAAAQGGAALEGNQSLREKVKDGDDSTHAQYRDYPGHVGESGPGAGEQKQQGQQQGGGSQQRD